MKLTIDMPWERDLSVNHCRMGPKGNWHLKEHVEAWMERLAWEIKLAMAKWQIMTRSPRVIEAPVKVTVDFRYPDNRRRDDHNYYKVICDAVAAGLGIDDKDIRISTGTVEVDRENPGVTITVEDEG